jgi:hypothetical protein
MPYSISLGRLKKPESDPLLYNMFALAEHLSRTVAEIEQMTFSEWNHWIAYLFLKQEKEKRRKKII